MIGVVKSGNSLAICDALDFLGIKHTIITEHEAIKTVSRIILPGVGHFDACSRYLEHLGIKNSLIDNVWMGKPILGICVGMQLLFNRSDEGVCSGLGLLEGQFQKFEPKAVKFKNYRVPHMGWNWVTRHNNCDLLRSECDKYYFVHSYFLEGKSPYGVGFTSYANHQFSSAVQSEHIFGVQFHPEKSNKAGLSVIAKFCEV